MKSASVSFLEVEVVVGDGGGKKVSESERGKSVVWYFVRVFVFEGGRRRVSGRGIEIVSGNGKEESGDRPQLEEVVTVGETVVRSTLATSISVQDTEEDSQR